MKTTDQQRAYGLYSDLFKDRNGIRPRWASDWSEAKLLAAVDDIVAEPAPVERDWLTLDVSDPTFQDEDF